MHIYTRNFPNIHFAWKIIFQSSKNRNKIFQEKRSRKKAEERRKLFKKD